MHKKTAGLLLGSAFLAIASFSAFSFVKNKQEVKTVEAYYTPSTHYEVSDTATELASYYSSASGKTGTALLAELQSINSTRRKKTIGYSTMGTSASSSPYIYTDYVLSSSKTDSNGQRYGTQIASFYTKTAATSWNREHMWPNSRGGSAVEGDILHTRPTISTENSSRGNSFYVEGMNNSSNGWDPYTAGYEEWVRGECARTILYCVVANSNFHLSDASSISSGQSGYTTTMGDMDTLIKWHFAYTPNEYEINRNNGAEYLQGNRNPFVDHPEYVAMIWSSFNSNITNICNNNSNVYSDWVVGSYSSYGTNNAVNPTTVGVTSISKTVASLTIGETTTISAVSSNSNSITWTSSDTSVATVSPSSAASGANVTITAVAAGSTTITAKITIGSTEYKKTCAVTVTASGGSGGSDTYTQLTSISNIDSSASYVLGVDGTGFHYSGTSSWGLVALPSSQTPLYYTLEKESGNTSFTAKTTINSTTYYLQIPTSNTFSMAASKGTNTSIIIGTTKVSGTNYAVANKTTTDRHLRINGTSGLRSYDGTTGSMAYFYKVSSSSKALSSIAVSTAPTKTTYTAGEYFAPTGLKITRNYSDSTSDTYTYAGHTNEFTFEPSTSTALTIADTSVTINYAGKSCTQAITVNPAPITSITAYCEREFYVGETITTSDITVEDNNGQTLTGFTFSNNGYQFKYTDAEGGGGSDDKEFTNSISYSSFTTSLTVAVARKAYVPVSSTVTDIITADNLTATSTNYVDFTGVSFNSNAVYAGNSAQTSSGGIQLRSKNSNSGIVSTTSGGTIKSVSIVVESGHDTSNTLNVYGSNSAYTSAEDLYGSNAGTLIGSGNSTGSITLTNPGNYSYIGLRSNNGAIYLTSISITYDGGSETANNVANYIMFEDTNNQCTTKLNTAIGYLNGASSAEKSTFQTSTDYVISTARIRLEAWAANQGKTINYSGSSIVLQSRVFLNITGLTDEQSNCVTLTIIISTITALAVGGYFFFRRKKDIND